MSDLLEKELNEIDRKYRKIPRVFGILFTLAIFVVIINVILYLKLPVINSVSKHGNGIPRELYYFISFLVTTFGIIPLASFLLGLLIALFIYKKRKYTKRLFISFSVLFLLLELYMLSLLIIALSTVRATVS